MKSLSGSSSSLSGHDLLVGIKKAKLNGTLVLSQNAGNMILKIEDGELLSRFCLGARCLIKFARCDVGFIFFVRP